MSKKSDKDVRVQQYLENEMDQNERQGFEMDLQSDQDLARTFSLHKEMEELLADSPENQLRRSLQQLTASTEPLSKPDNRRNYWPWLLAVAGLLLLSWWMLRPSEAVPSDPSPGTSIQPSEKGGNAEPSLEKEGTPPPALENDSDREEPASPAHPLPKKAKPKDLPIAANFTPIPELDMLIDNPRRGEEIRVSVNHQQENIQQKNSDAPVRFYFSGSLSPGAAGQSFTCSIFSNDQEAFESFEGILKRPLKLSTSSDGVSRFDLRASLSLQPGLYYYLIEDSAEQVLFVQKFTVK